MATARKTPTKTKSAPARKAAAAKKPAAKKSAAAEAPKAGGAKQAKSAPTAAPAPKEGALAPDFDLAADDGGRVRLADLRGKRVVLYFYPRDMTPGCTVEACGFRDQAAALARANVVVLGVSRDSVASHQKFKAKEQLSFPLLSDPEATTIAAYGSWGEKSFMGRKSVGILRTTVLIDEAGRVLKRYAKVNTKTHAQDVLADLARLSGR